VLDIGRNPVSLVKNKGATRKVRKARSLTVEQFHALLKELQEPFATLALLCVCLGLRISEVLALRWSDVDWLGSRLSIRRGIVAQIVDDVKTEGSAKTLVLAEDVLSRLRAWKHVSQFSDASDWVFASPIKIGRAPIFLHRDAADTCSRSRSRWNWAPHYARFPAHVPDLAKRHRHTNRDTAKAHAALDNRHDEDTYGTVFDDAMSAASLKIAELAFRGDGAQDRVQSR
jgi:integrase